MKKKKKKLEENALFCGKFVVVLLSVGVGMGVDECAEALDKTFNIRFSIIIFQQCFVCQGCFSFIFINLVFSL